jgi:hypothetical protein
MPTGYTCIIHDKEDVTFKDYALRCARAFGALVEFRDEALDAPLPKRIEVDPYYARALMESVKRLETLKDADPREYGNCVKSKRVAELEESLRKYLMLRDRFDCITKAVQAWKPPTSKHEELKKFMLDQIYTDR